MCKDSNDTVAREPYLSTLVSPLRHVGADDALRWTLSPKEEQAELAYFRAQLEKALAALNAHARTTGVAEKADGPDPKGPDVDWAQVKPKRPSWARKPDADGGPETSPTARAPKNPLAKNRASTRSSVDWAACRAYK